MVNPLSSSGELEAREATPESVAGVWGDIVISAGIGDLSNTGNQAGIIIAIGFGRYGGIQFILRKKLDLNRKWYNSLRYLDGVSVVLGFGMGFLITLTTPIDHCGK